MNGVMNGVRDSGGTTAPLTLIEGDYIGLHRKIEAKICAAAHFAVARAWLVLVDFRSDSLWGV